MTKPSSTTEMLISSQIPCKESSSTYFKSTKFKEEQTITYDNFV